MTVESGGSVVAGAPSFASVRHRTPHALLGDTLAPACFSGESCAIRDRPGPAFDTRSGRCARGQARAPVLHGSRCETPYFVTSTPLATKLIARRFIAMNLGQGAFFLVNPVITWRSAETLTLWTTA